MIGYDIDRRRSSAGVLMYREAGGITDTDFREKLWAAKHRRSLTLEEMCKMTKASTVTMEKWLNGLSAPFSQNARESVIRAVE